VVAALRADNAWRSANGHPLAWDIPIPADPDGTSPPLPYIAFSPALASGSPGARTLALAETLERWRADANKGGGDGAFAEMIGGSRWRSEWYDVYLSPGGALRTDGRDPLTLVEVATSTSTSASGPESNAESSSESGYGAYVFSMERSACALFGIVTYGVHMTVYEQKGDADAGVGGTDGKVPMRVWVPRRAATKPTCVSCLSIITAPFPPTLLLLLHLLTSAPMWAYLSLLLPSRVHV